MLFDIRQIQSYSIHASWDRTKAIIEKAPVQWNDPNAKFLLLADIRWASSEACSLLLSSLKDRKKVFCLTNELADAWIATAFEDESPLIIYSLTEGGEYWQSYCNSDFVASQTQAVKKLAYFSPLPPERSGISYYSAALLPKLAKYFQIDVITDPAHFSCQAMDQTVCVYQLGNSQLHLKDLEALLRYSGLVVLHDFYVSHALSTSEASFILGMDTASRFYRDHGYGALASWCADQLRGTDRTIWRYPLNRELLKRASAVVVHGEEGRRLAQEFYCQSTAQFWNVIPHLKQIDPVSSLQHHQARSTLKLDQDDFIIASFGYLGTAKLSMLILEAFFLSKLSLNGKCMLIFVGACEDAELFKTMTQRIKTARAAGDLTAGVVITGWCSDQQYNAYLAAADLAVQLRTKSRGENSGAVLDCFAKGIPLIVNSHGSFADIPHNCVRSLAEDCTADELAAAIDELAGDQHLRNSLVVAANELVVNQHAPNYCASLYAKAAKQASLQQIRHQKILDHLVHHLHCSDSDQLIANGLTLLFPPQPRQHHLFLDVTAVACEDLGTGVQRVVRSLCLELLQNPPKGFRVEPVRADPDRPGYRLASTYTIGLLGLNQYIAKNAIKMEPEPLINFGAGDIFVGIDLHHHGVVRQEPFFQFMRAQGVDVRFVVHDILPCTIPDCFPIDSQEWHEKWLRVVTRMDGALCVSQSVASELRQWIDQHVSPDLAHSFAIDWFHHGCDFLLDQQDKSLGQYLPAALLKIPSHVPVLIAVGTIEPRKGYLDLLEAATILWDRGQRFVLVIVGREGWTSLKDHQRRTIPQTVAAIMNHPQIQKQLFWFNSVSDQDLAAIYRRSNGFVSSSYGEGFGIPIVEASSVGLPLLLRDLPVFREVSCGQAVFFPASAKPLELADVLSEFLIAVGQRLAPTPPHPQSWHDSAQQVLQVFGLAQRVESHGIQEWLQLSKMSDTSEQSFSIERNSIIDQSLLLTTKRRLKKIRNLFFRAFGLLDRLVRVSERSRRGLPIASHAKTNLDSSNELMVDAEMWLAGLDERRDFQAQK